MRREVFAECGLVAAQSRDSNLLFLRHACLRSVVRSWAFAVFDVVLSEFRELDGIDIKSIDPAVNPCQNFYLYACGSWKKTNPIPPQYSRWGRFNELQERNQKILRDILDDSAAHLSRSPVDQKIGTFYSACMNETAIDEAG